ncbi:MAG: aldehyde dehydrogenase family protein [Stutzerimonas stutzeri]
MADVQRYDNYIDGQWVASERYQANVNPSDLSDVIGEYAQADAAQVEQAIAAARRAFPAWASFGIQARADALEKVGLEILARREELGTLLAREEGKTLPEGIGEVARAGNIFKFFAGECLRQAGETLQSVRPGVGVEVTREPLGVIGLITPWNFPIAIPAWKIAPALAFGNCVVIKPADLVPGCAWALAEIIIRGGLPGRRVQPGDGPRLVRSARRMLNAKDVDAISFTGSQGVGRSIAQACVARGKPRCSWRWAARTRWSCWTTPTSSVAVELCAQSAVLLDRPALHRLQPR